MKYDFTTIIDRTNKDASALDNLPSMGIPAAKEGFSTIPMWVADMSFATAPSVIKAMSERLAHPIYGYFNASQEYYDKIIKWQSTQNHVVGLQKEHIGYANSVLGGVVCALNVFCAQGDKILLHSPTYVGFTSTLNNNGYKMVHSPLVKDEDNIWRMDFADMEECIKRENIHTTIFCSPHNPTGRVWERWELAKAFALFEKYDVQVISDEIWSDLTLSDYQHIPLQSISEDAKNRTIALYAPSKTFNLAGLVGSYQIVYNKRLRDQMEKQASLSHYNCMNVLSMHALLGAYEPEGYEWHSELRTVLTQNAQTAYEFFTQTVQGVTMSKPQGTYVIFIDCTQWLTQHNLTLDELLTRGFEYGVIWQDGRKFGADNSIRINLSLPASLLQEALSRLEKYVFVD